MDKFSQIDTWVFDLDNTLYPRECNLFAQIDVLMTGYVSRLTGLEKSEARKLQKDLYRDYGTTLRGLMETHGIDPHDFLNVVHDIDYSPLPNSALMGEKIEALPGRKLIYTNGSVEHAVNTLKAMGIGDHMFEGIFDIVASDFEPKPHPGPFDRFVEIYDIDPQRSAMFEDLPRNLEPAKRLGMTTVLVIPQPGVAHTGESWEAADGHHDHVDHKTSDLHSFVDTLHAVLQ